MSISPRQWRTGPVVAAGALVVALTIGPAQAQDKTFTMKITTPTLNAALDIYAKAYGDAVEKDSGGRIKVEVYPASRLGAIPRQIEGVQFGAIQCAVIPPEFFVGVDERFEVLAAPGLVTSAAQGHRVAADPAVQKFYLGLGAEKGLHGVAVAYAEPSEVVAKSAIRHLADFKGKKIRIFASEFQSASFKRLGTTPVAMSPGDVVAALQQGSLDASVAGVELLSGLHFYDAAKYITMTEPRRDLLSRRAQQEMVRCAAARSAADRREGRRQHRHKLPVARQRDRQRGGQGLDRQRRRIDQFARRRAGGITEDAVQRRRRYFEGEAGAGRGL